MVGYSFFIWISFIPMLVTYFRIICAQIIGLLGYDAAWIAPSVSVFLVAVVVFVRKYHIGQEILAFGIISIITYVIFLVWAQVTAPQGPKSVPENGYPYFMAASLVGAFEIHDFLAQNILKNPDRSQYRSIVSMTFMIGGVLYLYISLGSIGKGSIMQLSSTEKAVSETPKSSITSFVMGSGK